MEDHDVSISLGEGLLIAPGVDIRSYSDDLDIMAELRIPRINTVSLEPDRARTFDELAALTALAAERASRRASNPLSALASQTYRRPWPPSSTSTETRLACSSTRCMWHASALPPTIFGRCLLSASVTSN
jgi:hypothetical protein